MRVLRLIIPALVAGGVAAALAAAPSAVAEPACEATGAGGGEQGGQNTVCSSPGNVQIDSRPSVYAQPWYGDPFFGAGMVF